MWRAQRVPAYEAGLFEYTANEFLSAQARKRASRHAKIFQMQPTGTTCEQREITNPEAYAEASEQAEEFEDAQDSGPALVGATFETADASKLLRYEAANDQMIRKLLKDLHELQDRRCKAEELEQFGKPCSMRSSRWRRS